MGRKKVIADSVLKGRGAPLSAGTNKPVRWEEFTCGLLFFSLALLFSTNLQVNFTLPKLAALRIGALLVVLVWLYRLKRNEVIAIPKTILFPAMALGVWWIGSTFFAVHKPTALNGVYGRYNGLWSHLIYLLLFLSAASSSFSVERSERVLRIFIAALIPVALYAVFQYCRLDPLQLPSDRTVSTIGQPVILAVLLGLAMPFILTFQLRAAGFAERLWWGAVMVIFIIACGTTFSRGPWIAIAVSLIMVLFLHIKRKGIEFKAGIAVITVGIVCLALAAAILLRPAFLDHQQSPVNIRERLQFFTQAKIDRSILSRIVYYRAAFQMLQEHPFVGIGFENFRVLYPRYRPMEDNKYFLDVIPTMVHDGYLQTALTNGIPALLCYVVLIAFVLRLLFKRYKELTDWKSKSLATAFTASITGYLIQDLSGWLEIALTPFFWILLGLAVSFCCCGKKQLAMSEKGKSAVFVVALISIVLLLFLSVDAFRRIEADRLLWNSNNLDVGQDWREIEANLARGMELLPGDAYYEDQAALFYMRRLDSANDRDAYEKGGDILEKAHVHNPFDPYVLLHRIDNDEIALKKGFIKIPSGFGEKAMGDVLDLDKNNPTVYESIARLYFAEKKFDDALYYIKKAILLSPGKPSYYLLEGDSYGLTGNFSKAEESFSEALKIDPGNVTAKKGLEELRQISGKR